MTGKAFYIETFGCQMNAHDSEKVVGTLLAKGYNQVDTPEAADLVLYNTCSIRDKAEQKVYTRLQNFKRAAGKGKVFGVLGCVAQQEGENIFARAPHVSLVAGSASYTRLPEMLVQLEAGNRRVTGLSLDTDETFDTPFTRRDNPHRAYITIIEGCDKSCAYCVVPFTRGPERSRTSDSVLAEAGRLADAGYTEIQLLGQNVNSYRDPSPAGWDFATLLSRTRRDPRHSPRALHHVASARLHQGYRRRHGCQSGAVQSRALAGAVRIQPRARLHAAALHARRIHAAHRLDRGARRNMALTTDIIVGFPGETEVDFEETLKLLDEVQYDSLFSFKYSPRPNTAALAMEDKIPEEEKTRRLVILNERQRAIQIRRNTELIGGVEEVLVEGRHEALGQWIGRTSQNRTLNFTHAGADGTILVGRYMDVRVTRSGPNSLAGESVTNVV